MRSVFILSARALGLGLAWAAIWVPIGAVAARLLVGELEPEHLAGPLYAAVLCGAIFSALGGVASGRVRLEAMSGPRALACGALTGLLVGVLPFVLGDDGSYSTATAIPAVATSALAAAIAAWRLRWPRLSAPVAAVWGAVLSGLAFGAFQYAQGTRVHAPIPQWMITLLVIGGMTALSAVSAVVSAWFPHRVASGYKSLSCLNAQPSSPARRPASATRRP